MCALSGGSAAPHEPPDPRYLGNGGESGSQRGPCMVLASHATGIVPRARRSLMILLAAALAQEVAVTEARYRELVTREQQLVVCTEAQDRTLDALLACYRRAGEARELIRAQLDKEERGDEAALEQLAAVAEERDALSRKLARVRSQRNTLAAVGLAVVAAGAVGLAVR